MIFCKNKIRCNGLMRKDETNHILREQLLMSLGFERGKMTQITLKSL